jgi:hypothetical protein
VCGNRSADMRRTDRLRSVRELNPHAGLPAAARTRAHVNGRNSKRGRHQRQPLYTHVGSPGQDIGRRTGSQAGAAKPAAQLAYLHTAEEAILGSPSNRPLTKRPS